MLLTAAPLLTAVGEGRLGPTAPSETQSDPVRPLQRPLCASSAQRQATGTVRACCKCNDGAPFDSVISVEFYSSFNYLNSLALPCCSRSSSTLSMALKATHLPVRRLDGLVLSQSVRCSPRARELILILQPWVLAQSASWVEGLAVADAVCGRAATVPGELILQRIASAQATLWMELVDQWSSFVLVVLPHFSTATGRSPCYGPWFSDFPSPFGLVAVIFLSPFCDTPLSLDWTGCVSPSPAVISLAKF